MRFERFLKPSHALTVASVGLALLLPWRAADVLSQWRSLSPVATAAAQQPTEPTPPAPPKAPTMMESADARLLLEVTQRKAELDRREAELDTRAAKVAAAEQLARQQIAELERLRADVQAIAAKQFEAAADDLNLLVGLYSNMKPTQAAAVLGKLDAPKAAAILERLDTRSAGPILAGMDPQAALAITNELEQRHAAFRH
jgi:flagellar motility protein MotE (MotC chaperone)